MKKGRISRKFFTVLLLSIVILPVGCRVKTDDSLLIYGLLPNSFLSRLPFTLTVSGRGFNGNCVIVFNNIEMVTRYDGQNILSCGIEPNDTALSPITGISVPVYVIDKNNSAREAAKKSDVHYFSIRNQPEFSEPVTICTEPIPTYVDLMRLIIDEKPRFYLKWRVEKTGPDGKSVYPYMLCISEDSGETWSQPIEIPGGHFFFARDGILHAWRLDYSTNRITLYKSGDSGQSWTGSVMAALDESKMDSLISYQVVVDKDGGLLFFYGEIYDYKEITLRMLYSPDFGGAWELKSENVIPYSTYSIPGLTWAALNNKGDIRLGYEYHYGRYGDSGSFISMDGGQTFEESFHGFQGGKAPILTDQGELYIIYASLISPYEWKLAFFKGSDLGTVKIRYVLFENFRAGDSDMIMDGWGNLYIAMKGQMVRSIDDGENWSEAALYTEDVRAENARLAIDNDSVIYVVWNDESGIYLSTITNM
jgi:hypothetical protein